MARPVDVGQRERGVLDGVLAAVQAEQLDYRAREHAAEALRLERSALLDRELARRHLAVEPTRREGDNHLRDTVGACRLEHRQHVRHDRCVGGGTGLAGREHTEVEDDVRAAHADE